MISKRIKAIAKYIKPYKKIADIGCDHGYLIIEAFENQKIDRALAIDNKIEPLNNAKNNMINKEYFNSVEFILSDGISGVTDGVEVVIIAGMGGMTIINILRSPISSVKRYVLQANRNTYQLRKHMQNIGYGITNEEIVYEDSKYYEIIIFEKKDIKYTEEELKYGPFLIKNKDRILEKMLKEKIEKYKKRNENGKIDEKIKELNSILCRLKR